MLRPLRALAALALVAFTLTGCIKMDMDLTINGDNDTISGSMIFAMDKEILTMGGKSPEESFKESSDDFDDDLPKGSRSEVYDDGEFYGQKIIFEEVPFSAFDTKEDGPAFVHENGKYIFTMKSDMSSDDLGEDADMLGPMLKNIEFKIVITFPGDVIEQDEHAKVDGQTVTWELKMGETYNLRAVSEEGSAFPWLLLGGVAALFGLLVVAGIIVLIVRANGRPKAQATAGTDPAAAATAGLTTPTAPYPTVSDDPGSVSPGTPTDR